MKKLRRSWESEQDDVLRAFGPSISAQRLAARLGRSTSAIKDRARKLGVALNKPDFRRDKVTVNTSKNHITVAADA